MASRSIKVGVLLSFVAARFLLAMTTQAATAHPRNEEMQANATGWRWDTGFLPWTARYDLVATPIAVPWIKYIPATLQATLINEGKNEGAFAILRRWDIQTWNLEQAVRTGLRDYAE